MKLKQLIFVMILIMTTACGTVKQIPQTDTQSTSTTLHFTAQLGCDVPFESVDLAILIAESTILEGEEREAAMAIYLEEYTGWQEIRVRKPKDDDIKYIYEPMQKKNVVDLQMYSEEYTFLELVPGQEKALGEVYTMVPVIEHFNEMDSQRLR